MKNRSVYPESTRDESHLPCFGSIAIPRSTSYKTRALTSFMKLQRFPETPVSSLEEHQFQYSNSRKAPFRLGMRADSLSSTEEVSQISTSTSRGVSLSNKYVRGTLCFMIQVELTPRYPDSKEGPISLHWLKSRLIFHLTR